MISFAAIQREIEMARKIYRESKGDGDEEVNGDRKEIQRGGRWR
jgi:hypothetical protein